MKPIGYLINGNFYDENISDSKLDLVTPLYTEKLIVEELTDEVWNKAFDFYCETDEGVLRFNYELRDEWKKEQLIRWKEAFKKASEK